MSILYYKRNQYFLYFQVDLTECIFCQRSKRENFHLVQSFGVHNLIHKCIAEDYALKCRTGQNDLVAYEAHYHKTCRIKIERKSTTSTIGSADASEGGPKKIAFTKLVTIIQQNLKNGCVYSMDDVCSKYWEFLALAGDFDPSCRSHHSEEKLSDYSGSLTCFRKQRTMNYPLLLFPNVLSGEAVEALKTVTETQLQILWILTIPSQHRRLHHSGNPCIM